jgi:hypothetical protein
LKIDPTNYLSYLVLAYVRPIYDYERSFKDVEKAIEINPKSSSAYFISYLYKISLGNRKGWESDWANAIKYASEEESNFLTLFLKREITGDFVRFNRCGN